eukprot:TRINITY_DN5565_c0_g1_i1.p1 TRINITY_DN5565_c0_g1~~TRINITY_DN5565_c0_g1_i1.p1  ORF type:complete len:361 (+),score=77.03 TRINITY_DN5565_c0_g1_i1:139-1221(+)
MLRGTVEQARARIAEVMGAGLEAAAGSKREFLSRPSFFMVYLADGLSANLQPAIAFALKKVAAVSGSPVAHLLDKHRRAVSYALLSALEANSLFRHDATLGEYFWGLQRVNLAKSGNGTTPFTTQQKVLSLVLLIGIPALIDALSRMHKHMDRARQLQDVTSPAFECRVDASRLRRVAAWIGQRTESLFIAGFPWCRGFWELLRVACYVLYLRDHMHWPTPAFGVIGCSLAFTPPEISSSAVSRALYWPHEVLKFFMPMLLLGYQSLQWWYSAPRTVAPSRVSALPPPPPPKLWKGVRLGDLTHCPLCHRPRANPALLTSSGFAFCYTCILRYVRQHQRCPLTGAPANESQVWRLFLSRH